MEVSGYIADAADSLEAVREAHGRSSPTLPPSSAPTAPRPRPPRKSLSSEPTSGASATSTGPPQTPASPHSKKHGPPSASAPSEPKPTSTPHEPNSNDSANNSVRRVHAGGAEHDILTCSLCEMTGLFRLTVLTAPC